jgi:histidyl-tRNA synthetase
VADVGGNERISGVGFAMGDMVIALVAAKYKVIPPFAKSPATALVTVFDANGVTASLKLAAELRAGGIPVELYPDPIKLEKQLKYADAQGIKLALIIGPDEAREGKVTLKNLESRTQVTINRAEIVSKVREIS